MEKAEAPIENQEATKAIDSCALCTFNSAPGHHGLCIKHYNEAFTELGIEGIDTTSIYRFLHGLKDTTSKKRSVVHLKKEIFDGKEKKI